MIEYNMTESTYRYHAEVSNSELGLLEKSPAHLKAKIWESTPAMLFGSAYHMAILEQVRFLETYLVAPEINGRTKAGKVQYADLMARVAVEGRILIKQENMDRIQAMKKVLRSHTVASGLLTEGKPEVSVFWQDAETGLGCKCRVDYIRESLRAVTDLKTTQDASLNGFRRSIANFGYHRQAGYYLEGLTNATGDMWDTWIFVAQESKPPYGVAVYLLEPEDIQQGWQEAKELLRVYKDCKEKDVWPGYPDRVQTISLPRWAKNQGGVIYG